jgi:CheY-like chemotaxis protein/Tfp pilus assembly protein PilZ
MDEGWDTRALGVRRDHRSEPITLIVEYEEAGDLVIDFTDNLAAGRVFVPTRRDLAAGSPVHLVLSFPGLLHPVRLGGRVQTLHDGREAGVEHGVDLELDDDDGLDALRALVDRIRLGDPSIVGPLLKVLVVEDNPQVARLIRDGLRGSEKRRAFGSDLAFDVRTAGNGRDALERLHQSRFDMMILDVYLPVLDGAQVLQHIRGDEGLRDLPVIAVSAGGDSARDEAMAAGADYFLHKPMRLRQVVETIQRLMNPEIRESMP